MLVRRGSPKLESLPQPVGVTFGNFDGFHRGHQLLVSHLRKRIGVNGSLVVVSFYPHPVTVLKGVGLPRIAPISQTFAALDAAGVDVFYLVKFSRRFAQLSPKQFLHDYFVDRLAAKVVVTGPDARFGNKGAGDVAFLASELPKLGIEYEKVEFEQADDDRVSSRRIRQLIGSGDVKRAALLIGRPYRISGRVQPGAQRGSQIGIPTANIILPKVLQRPAYGVYVTVLEHGTKRYPSVTNVGVRPTVDGHREIVETHAIDAPRLELYGERIRLTFLEHLREERRFADITRLKEQIAEDIVEAKRVFRANPHLL